MGEMKLTPGSTLRDAIQQYRERGFGSMNKNDFEVAIFNLLMQEDEMKGKSNYDLSWMLRIPESKVKRLAYESSLKYQSVDSSDSLSEYKEMLKDLISNAKFRGDKKGLQFVVENLSLRQYVNNLLKKDHRVPDSSFNTEIVSLSLGDLSYLVASLFYDNEKERKEVENKALEASGSKIEFTEVVYRVVEGLAEGAASDSLGKLFSAVGLVSLICKIFTNKNK